VTEINFYHLQRASLDRALPKLLERVLQGGHRAVVVAGSPERVEHLNTVLWTYDFASFLPHGTAADGHGARQPLYLTAEEENPGRADILVLVDGADPVFKDEFDRCLDMFDGNDDRALAAARERWKAAKAAGHPVAYWKQGTAGGWERAEG